MCSASPVPMPQVRQTMDAAKLAKAGSKSWWKGKLCWTSDLFASRNTMEHLYRTYTSTRIYIRNLRLMDLHKDPQGPAVHPSGHHGDEKAGTRQAGPCNLCQAKELTTENESREKTGSISSIWLIQFTLLHIVATCVMALG